MKVYAINGADVEGLSHSDAMTHAKVHDNHIEMTVIDPAALKLFQKLGIKITTELAELLASFKIIKRQLSEPPQYEEATAPEPEPEEEEPEPEAEEPEPEEESDRLIEHPALAAAAIAKVRVNKSLLSLLPPLITEQIIWTWQLKAIKHIHSRNIVRLSLKERMTNTHQNFI